MGILIVLGSGLILAATILIIVDKIGFPKKAKTNSGKKSRLPVGLIIAGVALFVIGSSVQIIPTGYTGVRTTFGQISQSTVPNGFAIKIPLVQNIIKINNKQQNVKLDTQVWGETSDKTPVYATDTVISYKVASNKSAWIVANISEPNDLIDISTVSSAIKAAMVELGVEEVTVRTKIEPLVKEKLIASFNEKYGEGTVEIVKVVINNMDFEDAYNEAIAQKSIARQTQERQAIENQTNVEKAEADKKVAIAQSEAKAKSKLIEAEAEAEANKKISQSLTENIINNKAVDKWNGELPIVSGSGSIVDIGSIMGEE